jgi:hypothetical protein
MEFAEKEAANKRLMDAERHVVRELEKCGDGRSHPRKIRVHRLARILAPKRRANLGGDSNEEGYQGGREDRRMNQPPNQPASFVDLDNNSSKEGEGH